MDSVSVPVGFLAAAHALLDFAPPIAALIGATGLSLLLALIAATIACWLSRPGVRAATSIGIAVLLLATASIGGAMVQARLPRGEKLRVAVLQAAIPRGKDATARGVFRIESASSARWRAAVGLARVVDRL
ncbi:MAG: hypothetical protein U0V87_06085 [Acidobacteriota bacterium]